MADNDILTEDERDALLEGVVGVGVEPDPTAFEPSGEVQTHAFATQGHLAPGRLQTLKSIHDRFSVGLSDSLFRLIRRATEVTAGDVQTLSYSDYVSGQPDAATIILVNMAPLEGIACFTLDAALVFTLVESFFGGAGRDTGAVQGRECTATELRVVRRVLGLAFADFQKACKAVVSLDLECSELESRSLMASLANSHEVVAVSVFRVELDGKGGDLQIAMPCSLIESLDSDSSTEGHSDQGVQQRAWGHHLRSQIEGAQVMISSTLTETDITVGDLIELKAGDIVPVDMREAVCATVDGVPVFRGKFGVSRGSFALQVVDAPHTAQFEASTQNTEEANA